MNDQNNPNNHTIYNSTTVPRSTNHHIASFLRHIQTHTPNHSGQLFGFLALFISGGFLLILTGVTVTSFVLGFVVLLPIIIISSPLWFPLLLIVTGFLSFAGFLFGTVGVVTWMFRYFKGMRPLGSDQVDYARSRVYYMVARVKDYVSGYLNNYKMNYVA
ncbi:unnamed protein product [Cochlearia groenlandica]